MATLSVISWRDIPAQVVAKRGRESAKLQLPDRFQEAIDRAAMRAGKAGTDAYLEDWKRGEPQACGDDLEAEAARAAAELDSRYDDARLEELVRAGGLDPSASHSAGDA